MFHHPEHAALVLSVLTSIYDCDSLLQKIIKQADVRLGILTKSDVCNQSRSEKMLRRVFQESFSTLCLCTDIFIVFILECAHCIAFHVLRKLLCGLLFTCLSSLSAPGLTDCYNVVVWPLALCCLQVV